MKSALGFGERLKAARKQAGLTQEQVASLAEFSPISLSKLETGRARPTFEVLLTLAHALQVSPDFLAGWDERRSDESEMEKRLLINRLVLSADNLSVEWLEQLLAFSEKLGRTRTDSP